MRAKAFKLNVSVLLTLLSLNQIAPSDKFNLFSIALSQPLDFYYKVKQGDTILTIALNNNLSPKDLLLWNCLSPQDQLNVGMAISLKPTGINCELRKESVVSDLVFTLPLDGKILGTFNEGGNKGISIGGYEGQAIKAAADGLVVYSGNTLAGYGNLIILKHNDIFLPAYAHNRRLLVVEGDRVSSGQKIAELGSYQNSDPKLHFEIRMNGKPVDPLPYLNKNVTQTSQRKNNGITEAKDKCIELGLKQGTEGFGKCVLRLSQ
jgi:lipoprotein NlpD